MEATDTIGAAGRSGRGPTGSAPFDDGRDTGGEAPAAAGPPGARASDDTYWVFSAGLVYRSIGGAVSALGLALNAPRGTEKLVVVVAMIVAVAVGAAVTGLRASLATRADDVRTWLLADAVALVLLNLWASREMSGSLSQPFRVVFWSQVQGAVAMWWAVAGPWTAAAGCAAGAGLVLAMVEVNGRVGQQDVTSVVLTQSMWLGLAVLATLVLKALLATRSTVALDEGVEAGQELQRLRHLREVHDTVLQTLEGIALYASMSYVDEGRRLEAIAESARAEALRLRESLQQATPAERAGAAGDGVRLEHELEACVDAFRGRGLPVDLDVRGPSDGPALPPAARAALRNATTEALTNVLKHAHADRVSVALTRDGEMVTVVVEDDGRGFEPGRTTEGFGLPQSIKSRLREVGGTADIRSSPGRGTRVVLRLARDRAGAARVSGSFRRQTSAAGSSAGGRRSR